MRISKRIVIEIARKGVISKRELSILYNLINLRKTLGASFEDTMSDIEKDFYVVYERQNDSYRLLTEVSRKWWIKYYSVIGEYHESII
ncbi:MAG: hypothetical protein HQL01_14260 [Nitrospirae bacterium]|nr:hypothetical protein [Nitrospirota bacterium]